MLHLAFNLETQIKFIIYIIMAIPGERANQTAPPQAGLAVAKLAML